MSSLASSSAYRTRHCLDYREALEDGFLDGGRRGGRELLRVSFSGDARLARFLQFIEQRRRSVSVDGVTKLKIVALAIADVFGGSDSSVSQKTEMRCKELRLRSPEGIVDIGDLMGGKALGDPPGTGICRHRAILFKAACDRLALCPARLVRGSYRGGEHVWNLARVGGAEYLVDLMHFKVDLYDEAGPMVHRYIWLGCAAREPDRGSEGDGGEAAPSPAAAAAGLPAAGPGGLAQEEGRRDGAPAWTWVR